MIMSVIFQYYVCHIPILCLSYTKIMSRLCLSYTKIMSVIYQNYVCHIPRLCLSYFNIMLVCSDLCIIMFSDRFEKSRLSWSTNCFLQTRGWRFCTLMFWPLVPRMSFINGLLDLMASTSFQPSYTVTQRFCSGQIWLQWIGTVMRIPSFLMRRLPGSSSASLTDFRVWCPTLPW